MLVWMSVTVVLCALAGVVLITLGLRGKATDSHPICRRCGFDLQGRFPWSEPTCPTCPDCGKPLLTYRSVRPGARSRRTRLLACGCMLSFPVVVLLLAGAADTLAGKTTAALKPTTLLAAQISSSTKASAPLRELTTRIAGGRAAGQDVYTAVERALSLQADRTVELDPEWIDLLETARLRGLLTPQQRDRYFESAFDWRLLTLPTSERAPLHFGLHAIADRLAAPPSSAPLIVTVTHRTGALGGKPLRFGETRDRYDTPPVTATLARGLLLEVVDTAGHNAQPGSGVPLSTTWFVEIHAGAADGPLVAAWVQKADALVTVNLPGSARLHRVPGDDKARDDLIKLINLTTVHLERDELGGCWASFAVKPAPLPADVVATLRVTSRDGFSYDSVTPVTITPSDPRWPLLSAADPARSPWKVRVQLDGTPSGDTAAVELVPMPGFARSTLASPVLTGKPLRFENVELKWPASRPMP